MAGLVQGFQESVGRRGIISTTALIALTLYSAKESFYGAAGAAEIVSRVAMCAKNIATTAVSMPGWAEFSTKSKHYMWQVWQPTKTVNAPVIIAPRTDSSSARAAEDSQSVVRGEAPTTVNDGDSLGKLIQKTAFHLVKGAVAYDLRVLTAGAPVEAYNTVLRYITPFKLDTAWRGPLAQFCMGRFPEQVRRVQSMNFYI